jgi:ADP-heptose:LPS heptosyltransferase
MTGVSRLATRLRLLARLATRHGRRVPPTHTPPRRILIAHHLLLGDTLMLTALVARLRRKFPQAEILMTVPPALAQLYEGHPYGLHAEPWDPRDGTSLDRLIATAGDTGFDLALVPGDNRYALLARALGSCWVVALAEATPSWKARLADQLLPWPTVPTALADIFASLAGTDGDDAYDPACWPAPPAREFSRPSGDYVVLHVGAGSLLRLWPEQNWLHVADALSARGLQPVWCGGPDDVARIAAIDPLGRYRNLAGALDLSQLWHLLAGARLLICLDSGVSHLARLTGTASVVLYGPGSPVLFGSGRFFRDAPFAAVWDEAFACRDQHTLFKRSLPWVRRCQRDVAACERDGRRPRCMEGLTPAQVLTAAEGLLTR